jgi:hypothetical protein
MVKFNNFAINIFCLTAEYHKLVPSELLNLGYIVKPLWTNSNAFTKTNGVVSLLAYLVEPNSDKSELNIIKDIRYIFKNIKGYYYGVR